MIPISLVGMPTAEADLQIVAATRAQDDGSTLPIVILRVVKDGEQMLFEYTPEMAAELCLHIQIALAMASSQIETNARLM